MAGMDKERSIEEWERILGTNADRKVSKEEYEKILKKQQQLEKIKGLLAAGKNTLGSIAKTVGPIASKVADRLQANYDTAIGQPRFGASIREALGYNQSPLRPPQQPRPVYPFISQYGSGIPFITGPQYPRELFSVSPNLLNVVKPMPQMPPSQVQVPTVQQTMQTPTTNSQVVFLYNDKDDKVTEVMSEYQTVQEAEAETARLRKQGLPAFYGTKGEYINNGAKLKA